MSESSLVEMGAKFLYVSYESYSFLQNYSHTSIKEGKNKLSLK